VLPCLLAAPLLHAQAVTPRCVAEPGRRADSVQGAVVRDEAFAATTPGGWLLTLAPVQREGGWMLQVTTPDRPDEDLARLTPPLHFTPNSREIYGWHFRNAANTGPNDGSVNASGAFREFIFSPEVGREIQGPDAQAGPTAKDAERVEAYGRGWLLIESYVLTPAQAGERAAFESLSFSACLTWPE
jgi:hypothetical protein